MTARALFCFRLTFGQLRDWFFGNDEDVNGGLRTDIVEGETLVVLEHDRRRNFTTDYLTKYSVTALHSVTNVG